jgi:hypothetical protein
LKKGVIFTLDAVIALLAASVIILSIYLLIGNLSDISDGRDLQQIGQDALTVLEKDGSLAYAIQTKSNVTVTTYLDELPAQYCARIQLLDSNQDIQFSAVSGGCGNADRLAVSRRIFISERKTYMAEIETWIKEN